MTSSTAISARESIDGIDLIVTSDATAAATAVGWLVGPDGPVPEPLGVDRASLAALGFEGKAGSAVCVSSTGGVVNVAVGCGPLDALVREHARLAGAGFARATTKHATVALHLPDGHGGLAHAVVEGLLLARYRHRGLARQAPPGTAVQRVELVVGDAGDAVAEAAERGRAFAAAEILARDLANTPHSHLTATAFAEVAGALAETDGFTVELFDGEALVDMGCGGLLAINAGSTEPPVMIKLGYHPSGATAHLGLVGKGVMYDSGGISLKPSDMVHARMKNDMSGAASCLAVVAGLARLGAPVAVTAFLPCTDNMPSGSATALGDVITVRGGTTVEMIDTDAEGRVIMADALALAAEAGPDAIVDIATLTGSCARALGPEVAGVFGTSAGLVDQVRAAAVASGEPVWELPVHRPYRKMLDSRVADLMNCGPVGLPDAILATLFLAEFTGEVPWAHLDIAGTAWSDTDEGWRTKGATAFGTRLLLELALAFERPG